MPHALSPSPSKKFPDIPRVVGWGSRAGPDAAKKERITAPARKRNSNTNVSVNFLVFNINIITSYTIVNYWQFFSFERNFLKDFNGKTVVG
jgi:hypothetical protein